MGRLQGPNLLVGWVKKQAIGLHMTTPANRLEVEHVIHLLLGGPAGVLVVVFVHFF